MKSFKTFLTEDTLNGNWLETGINNRSIKVANPQTSAARKRQTGKPVGKVWKVKK